MAADITTLTALAAASSDDILYIVDAPGGTPLDRKITVANLQSSTQGGVAYTWPVADGTATYVLTTNGAGVLTWAAGGGSIGINDLTDVTITAAASGDLLRYNGSAWVDYPDSNYAAASHTHAAANVTDFSTAADARISAAVGVSVQAYDADLAAIAGLSSADGNFIVGSATGWVVESGATARTSLGVDAAGTDNSTNVTLAGTLDYITITGQEITRGAIDLATDITLLNLAQFDILYGASATGLSRLGGNVAATNLFLRSVGTGAAAQAPSWEAVTKTDVGLSAVENTALSTWAGSTAITTLGTISTGTVPYANLSGVDPSGTDNSVNVTLVTTSHDYLSIIGQAITLAAIDLAADVTGVLPAANGGTAQSTYAAGDIIYASALNTLSKLSVGASPDGYVLTLASGVPSWAVATGGTSTWTHATTFTTLDNAGDNVGINAGASPAAKLHVLATTEQLRLGYDASNYASFTTSSAGDLTITATGADIKVNGLLVFGATGSESVWLNPSAHTATYQASSYNTAVGNGAGNALTSSNTGNTFIGRGAGQYTSGNATYNVAIGYNAYGGTGASNGDFNTFIGQLSGSNITTGSYNTFLGSRAGSQSGAAITTGSYNIMIGHDVGFTNSATASTQLVIGTSTNRAIWSADYTVGINVGGPANGQGLGIKSATALLSAMSGATVTSTNLIPAGSTVLGVTIRVTTLITSGDGGTTLTIGDGTDVDAWGTGIAFAANTTTTGTAFTVTTPAHYAAATSVVLTCTGGTFSAGAVRVTVHYLDYTAATS